MRVFTIAVLASLVAAALWQWLSPPFTHVEQVAPAYATPEEQAADSALVRGDENVVIQGDSNNVVR